MLSDIFLSCGLGKHQRMRSNGCLSGRWWRAAGVWTLCLGGVGGWCGAVQVVLLSPRSVNSLTYPETRTSQQTTMPGYRLPAVASQVQRQHPPGKLPTPRFMLPTPLSLVCVPSGRQWAKEQSGRGIGEDVYAVRVMASCSCSISMATRDLRRV